MKKVMSVSEKVFLTQVVGGATLIVVGVVAMCGGLVGAIIEGIFVVVNVVCFSRVMIAKKENSDEMSDSNFRKAQAWALTIVQGVLIISAMVLLMCVKFPFGWDIDWRTTLWSIFTIIVGISDVVTGIAFRRLEAE